MRCACPRAGCCGPAAPSSWRTSRRPRRSPRSAALTPASRRGPRAFSIMRRVLVVLVALAGAAGVLSRYGLTQAFGSAAAPWTVVAINIAGSFLLGLLAGFGVG